ncbi:MAG: ParB/RepB/Spo0J family partition protein [Myxococcota bacterium]|nr:ParB/RepB/Spo0J family partition protein [Myxococcales bacterium]
MTAKRSALGRGLGALIPTARTPDAAAPAPRPPAAPGAAAAPALPAPGPLELPVDAIRPNPDQPRRVFDPEHLKELAESIARHGVLQPVVVRSAGDGHYELVVGERRWRASRAAGRETIPAVVADVEPRDRLELAIVENVQRHDLNPIELAHAYRALAATGATQDDIGARVGLDRSSVANHLRLLELPREMQEDVEAGRLTMGHAKALLQVTSPERQRLLRERILRDALSVRASEALARDYAGPDRPRKRARADAADAPPASDGDARAVNRALEPVAEQLRQRLQTRVRITGEVERGRIEIEFFGDEDLERITDLLLGGR